ncbi:lipid A ethanolaminephosphotransferase [Fluviicoccus keumensis]|uniref:Lipid A ethanolaminephosphotransferase n=1 Tax=Fluviicoccus keumensis TaxID=1435465 RepID=A0A4Q7Z9N1_9GAMM|nr:phosphoethanolamine--lipid A transferase [Fluviicoccus keumensis]RZU46771.1 lipid A ethanolaminephosphotransferase [Fluviicoccus keumensis]
MKARLNAALSAFNRWSPEVSTTRLALYASLFSSLLCNGSLWATLQKQAVSGPAGWFFLTAMFFVVTALQFILLSVLVNRWTAKPLLAVMVFLSGASAYFMARFGIYIDAAMAQNFLETDIREVRDLLAFDMIPFIAFYIIVPWVLLWKIRISRPPLRQCWYKRPLAILAAVAVTVVAVLPISKQLVPMMREHKSIRYLITPGNYTYALIRVGLLKNQVMNRPREVIGADAVKPPRADGQKPLLMVVVVGETLRAANWGLNGYARQTTPELATRQVINFPEVTSCGTNTATSLPCMFSVYGRRHYDEDKILGTESVLNVLQHAGLRVLWRDNQSGCKGVCKGVEEQVMITRKDPALCHGDECFDEILLAGLDKEVAGTEGDMVVVLHQMGQHGPAYFQRYPDAFRRFTPTCDTTKLETCEKPHIVNTYDNAVLYTDHVVAKTIDFLKSVESTHRTALLYVSDHGESLGENGMYLHSIPYSIAPDEQKHVPMVMWLSPDAGVNLSCLQQRARQPASHDNLFHTLLGVAGVKTSVYDAQMDLTAGCRQ